jgi:hypothetical protein
MNDNQSHDFLMTQAAPGTYVHICLYVYTYINIYKYIFIYINIYRCIHEYT